jgi:hypothetical protein
MISTIWDDINNDAEAIVLTDIEYEPSSLSNQLYEILDDKTPLVLFLKKNKLPSDFSKIKNHRDNIINDSTIDMLLSRIFKQEYIKLVTPLDRIFLNCYYRQLFRAKIEQLYMDKILVRGLIVTDYNNTEIDTAIIDTLRCLRVICRYLGIKSTIDPQTFSTEKLYMPSFWFSVTSKFVNLFGESRIEIIEADEQIPLNSAEALLLTDGQKQIRRSQVFMFLNIVFNIWSGSILVATDKDNIKIVPATYVTRMLPYLKDIRVD